MLRLLALIALFALVLGCAPSAAPLAPVPSGAGQLVMYFPTRVGTKWVYEQSWDDDFVETVTAVEEKDGRYIVTVATTALDDPEGLNPGIEKYLVSADGVFCVASAVQSETDRKDFDLPICLLKLPYKLGDKWGDPKTSRGESVTGKVETVKVPAGTFEAIRVDRTVSPGRIGTGEYSYWYTPYVGAVKMKINDKVVQMKSFTLPRD